jgi:hypothetical protein
MNKRLFRNTAILFFIIGFSNYLGNRLYLYWTTWWHDMIMHFIAGFVVAMTMVLVYQIFFKRFPWFKSNLVLISVLVTIFIGLLWEFFELHYEITSFADGSGFWTDTSSDLLLDTLGGYLGALYSIKISNNE